MKQLVLVRHGKSSWDYPVSDKDRALMERGIADAHLVAERFKKEQLAVDAVFSSPANRALHTGLIFMRVLELPTTMLQVREELYDFSGESVWEFVRQLPEQHSTIMLFGHNHAFTHLANTWGNEYIGNLSTSGLVHIAFPITSWKELEQGTTKQILLPKGLR